MKKLLLILLCITSYTHAQTTYTFNGNVSVDWNNSANWDGNLMPSVSSTDSDIIIIDSPCFYTDPSFSSYTAVITRTNTEFILNANFTIIASSQPLNNASLNCEKIVLNNNSTLSLNAIFDFSSYVNISNAEISGSGTIDLNSSATRCSYSSVNNVTINPGTVGVKGNIYFIDKSLFDGDIVIDLYGDPSSDDYDKVLFYTEVVVNPETVIVNTNGYTPVINDVFTPITRYGVFSSREKVGAVSAPDFQAFGYDAVIDLVDGTANGTLTVIDSQPPTINNCPSNQTVDGTSGVFYALPDYTTSLAATDNDTSSAITYTQNPLPGMGAIDGTVVTLTATDDSGNTSNCSFTLTVMEQTLTTQAPNNVADHMRIYPNPTNGLFTLENTSRKYLNYAEVIDIKGVVVYTIDLKTVSLSKSIALNQLQSGMYMFKVYTNEGFVIKKLLIE